MAGEGSKSIRGGVLPPSRAEIDALSEIIAATITMAVRTRSDAAAALLERALETLNDRIGAPQAQDDDGLRPAFKPS